MTKSLVGFAQVKAEEEFSQVLGDGEEDDGTEIEKLGECVSVIVSVCVFVRQCERYCVAL